MDIRDLIKRLDSITEEQDLTDFDTLRSLSNQGQLPSAINPDDADLEPEVAKTMQTTNDRVIFNKKQEHLYSLLKQLRDLVNRAEYRESKVSINKQLVESFGYAVNEQEQLNEDWTDTFSRIMGSSIGPAIRKIGLRFDFLRRMKSGYDQIKAIPESMPLEQKHAKISKIIGELASEYGLILVGSIIGGFVTAPGGPLASAIGSAIGALYTTWKWGDDVDAFVTDLVKSMYGIVEPTDSTPQTTSPDVTLGAGGKSTESDNEIVKIQQALVAKGAKIKVDGILGPETFKAFDQYGDSLEETVSLAESIKSLQDRLALIENPISEEFSIEAGKKKFAAKYPELAKKLGITAPASEPVTTTTGGSAKTVSQPNAPVSRPTAQPQQPTTGVGVAPFAQLDAKSRLDAMAIVKQIQAAIRDISNVPPSMQGDARKAIDHAQKTIQAYAPKMV